MANPLKMLDLKPQGFQFIEEIAVEASPAIVWKSLLNADGWFGFSPNPNEIPKASLEARPGGRFILEHKDGTHAMFGTVALIQPEKLLRLSGQLGLTHLPVTTAVIFELQPQNDGKTTLLRFCQRTFGFIDDGTKEKFQ